MPAIPYKIDVLFMYMANMAWNSAMNPEEVSRMLTDKDPATGRVPHPARDLFGRLRLRDGGARRPGSARHDISRTLGRISLLDRPIGSAEGPADAIRQPVLTPDRDVRPFQDVLLDLGARLGLPGFVNEAGGRCIRDYADYIVSHQRKPGVGPLAGFRGNGTDSGVGAPNPGQLDAYIANGCFWSYHLPPEQLYYKHANAAYLEQAKRMGFTDSTAQIVLQLYAEPLQKFRLAAEGHGAVQPPERLRPRIRRYFDPLPIWYPPVEQAMIEEAAYPLHAITQRPPAMYHSWHSQNAWLRQIYSHNKLFMHARMGAALGLADDDWAWVISRTGRVKVQVKLMEGVNPNTVWTWNAIGKRSGAWNLAPDAPEARQGSC